MRSAVRIAVLASSVLLWLGAPAAPAQEDTPSSAAAEQDQPMDQDAVTDPSAAKVPGTSPSPGKPSTGGPESDPTSPGYGDAADQPPVAKKKEAAADCVAGRPPTSRMLGVGGSVAGDDGSSWGWLVLLVAAGATALAVAAFVIRHRGGSPGPRGTLEIVSTIVAIFGGLAGLAVQFIPGIAAEEDPPPEAAMTVREVHARITRGEYARKTGSKVRLAREDRQEVGNVVWLEIQLEGYGGKRLRLQYGLYDPDPGGALLPGTAKTVRLRVADKDVQSVFAPIWVGYPKSERFEAQFRLLEGRQVRQMASTGRMRGSTYRYACAS